MPSLPSSSVWRESFYEFYSISWQMEKKRRVNVEQQLKLLGEQREFETHTLYTSRINEIQRWIKYHSSNGPHYSYLSQLSPLLVSLWKVYYKLPMTVCITSMLIIYFGVLLIPIGKSQSINTSDSNKTSDDSTATADRLCLPFYVIFEMIYTMLSYPINDLWWMFNSSVFFEWSHRWYPQVRSTLKWMTKLLLPLICLALCLIVYSMYNPQNSSQSELAIAITVPPTVQGLSIMGANIAAILYILIRERDKKMQSNLYASLLDDERDNDGNHTINANNDHESIKEDNTSKSDTNQNNTTVNHSYQRIIPFQFDAQSAITVIVCTVFLWLAIKCVYLVCVSLTVKSNSIPLSQIYPFWYLFMQLARLLCKKVARVIDSINATEHRKYKGGLSGSSASSSSSSSSSMMIPSDSIGNSSVLSSSSQSVIGASSSTIDVMSSSSSSLNNNNDEHNVGLHALSSSYIRRVKLNSNSLHSMELCIDCTISFFQLVFYRNLFLRVGSVSEFVWFKSIHVCGEVLVFCTRLTKWYFDWSNRWLQTSCLNHSWMTSWIISLLDDPSPYYVWCTRVSIDHSVRYMSSVATALGFIIGAVWTRRGWNSEFYDYQDVDDEQFRRGLIFVAVGMLIEMLVDLGLNAWVTRGLSTDFSRHWRLLVRHKPLYSLYFIILGQHVLTDVFVAKIKVL